MGFRILVRRRYLFLSRPAAPSKNGVIQARPKLETSAPKGWIFNANQPFGLVFSPISTRRPSCTASNPVTSGEIRDNHQSGQALQTRGAMLLEIITRREVSSAQPNPFDCAKGRPFNRSIAQGAANVRGYNCIPHCFERRNSHCPCNGRLPTLDLGRRTHHSPRDWAPFWQWHVPSDWQLIGAGGRLGTR
jgi:hypothetical protein